MFIGRTDAEAETPILAPPHEKSWLIGKDPDVGRHWRQEEGTREGEMAGWHHRLDGREFEWTPGVGDGQGGLASCDSRSCRVVHDWATELNVSCRREAVSRALCRTLGVGPVEHSSKVNVCGMRWIQTHWNEKTNYNPLRLKKKKNPAVPLPGFLRPCSINMPESRHLETSNLRKKRETLTQWLAYSQTANLLRQNTRHNTYGLFACIKQPFLWSSGWPWKGPFCGKQELRNYKAT